MRIKVGDRVFDGANEPVMVILSEQDKINIQNMLPSATKYCVYPTEPEWTDNNHEKIKQWMADIP